MTTLLYVYIYIYIYILNVYVCLKSYTEYFEFDKISQLFSTFSNDKLWFILK